MSEHFGRIAVLASEFSSEPDVDWPIGALSWEFTA
jgi:hypothetical protein